MTPRKTDRWLQLDETVAPQNPSGFVSPTERDPRSNWQGKRELHASGLDDVTSDATANWF